jgi:hypothetical protein
MCDLLTVGVVKSSGGSACANAPTAKKKTVEMCLHFISDSKK